MTHAFARFGIQIDDFSDAAIDIVVNGEKGRWELIASLRPRGGIQFEYAYTAPLEMETNGTKCAATKLPPPEIFGSCPVSLYSLTRTSTGRDLLRIEVESGTVTDVFLLNNAGNPYGRRFKEVSPGQNAEGIVGKMIAAYLERHA